MARDCRKKTEFVQNNQTSGWSGTDDKTKGKPGKGKGKQDKGNGTGELGKGKSKSKNGKGKQHGKKRKKGCHEMEGAKANKKLKPVKNTQSGWTRVGITLTTELTRTGGRVTGAQICGRILHGSKRQDS